MEWWRKRGYVVFSFSDFFIEFFAIRFPYCTFPYFLATLYDSKLKTRLALLQNELGEERGENEEEEREGGLRQRRRD